MATCHISNNIRTLRFFADEMTQQQLADKVGVTRQTIVAIENGKYSPTLELAFRISRVFGKPLEDVFSFDLEDDSTQNSDKKKKGNK
ncbi:helix-turn-helix transcriptional regulator [candidate division KSB1 bacterium]|nr:helix-turn-helix transcriptional regulator [candidate division KSB1 bacterium]